MERKQVPDHLAILKEWFQQKKETAPCDWEEFSQLFMLERIIYHKEIEVTKDQQLTAIYEITSEILKSHLNTLEYFLTQRSMAIIQGIDKEVSNEEDLMPYYLEFARFMKQWYLLELEGKTNSEDVTEQLFLLIPKLQEFTKTMVSLQHALIEHYDQKIADESSTGKNKRTPESSIFD
jgi:hypothetical protein